VVTDSAYDHWFEPVADHLGAAYLRYSFTKGTRQEAEFLVGALGLSPGDRVLDVGCGPGRHALALAERGIAVHGVDISRRFVDLARSATPAGSPATFERADARALVFDGEFDAALSLCQGAFGLVGPGPDGDEAVLAGMARAVRPGGRIAISAFSAYFQVRHPVEGAVFDAATATHHEHTTIKDEAGRDSPAELWTTCYTPRELSLLVDRAGLRLDHVWSVEPGAYRRADPTTETAEFLVVATRHPGPLASRP
jgi:SAM-dependent methyltransferase